MATDIDSLEIQINANATKANASVDLLAKKIDRLSTSLSTLDGHGLRNLASGVQSLGTAMQTMNNVKTTEFTRLAKNLNALNNINVAQLSNVSANVTKIGQSLSGLSGVSQGAQQIVELANGIKQLGYKSADKAITNIPQLATAMKQLMKELSTAPKVSQNLIDMTNALAKLARTGASSGRAAQSLSNSFTGIYRSSGFAVAGIKKVNARLVSLIRSIAPVVGLVKLIDFGKQAMEISSDLTEVQNVVDVTFGDYKRKIEDLASVSIPELGMSELSVKEIGSRFQAMGTAMGFSTEKMSDMSVELTRLAGDMASFYNVEQETMGKALQSIFTGETEPMRKYGIDLTNATIQQYALSQGITASINKMTQLEKAQLRYNYVMAQTTAAQGDFIRTQDTWANQVRILKENLKQLASIVGGTLINAFKPLVQAINSAMSHIIAFAQTVSNALGKIFGWKYEIGGGTGISSDFESASDSAGDIADSTGQAAKNIDKMKKGIRAFDELKTISLGDNDTGATGGNGSGGGAGATGGAGSDGGKWVQQDSIWKNFESGIDSLYKLGEYIGNALTKAMNSIDWDKVYEKAKNFGKGLAEFLNGLISPKLFGTVGETVAKSLNTAIYAALSFGETFDWENFGESIAESINKFFENFDFKALAKTLNKWADGIFKLVKTAIEKIKWKEAFKKIIDFVGSLELDTVLLLSIPTIKKFWKSFTGKHAINASKFVLGFKDLFKGDFFGNLKTSIKNLRAELSATEKLAIGAISTIAEFSMLEDAFYDLASGVGNVGTSIAQIGVTTGLTSLAMYTAFGPGGLVVGAVAGLAGAFSGLDKAIQEQKQIEVFGEKLDNITTKINETSNSTKNWVKETKEYTEDVGLAEAQLLSDMSDRYFELAQKENLSNEEKAEMQRLAEELVGKLPELEGFYNQETGLIEAQKNTVNDLIEAKLKEIQIAASQDSLLEAYKRRIEQEKAVKEATETAGKAQEEWNKLNEDYQKIVEKMSALDEYLNISNQISTATGNTDDLFERQTELYNFLTDNGKTDFPTMDALTTKMGEAQQAIGDFGDEYETTMKTLINAEEAYSAIEGEISDLTGMLKEGMGKSASEVAEGFKSGIESSTEMEDSVIDKARDMIDAFNNEAGIASPSKVFAESGMYCVEGFVKGIDDNEEKAIEAITGFANKIITAFSEKFGKGGENSMFSPVLTSFKSTWTELETWWSSSIQKFFNEKISVWFTSEKWKNISSGMKTGLTQKWNEFSTWWQSAIKKWWDSKVKTWFTSEKWKSMSAGMKTGLTQKWNEFSTWWQSSGARKWYNSYAKPWFMKNRWTFAGVKSGLEDTFNSAAEAVKKIWEGLAAYFEKNPISPTIDISTNTSGATSAASNTKPIPQYAVGGFPKTGQLFIAREAGAEMVGSIGSKTAVANNDQITKAISSAVYNAVVSAMGSYSGANVTFQVEGDPNGIFNVVQRKASEYSDRTGNPAFL